MSSKLVKNSAPDLALLRAPMNDVNNLIARHRFVTFVENT